MQRICSREWVDYVNSTGLPLGTPELWSADQLRAEGFHNVVVVEKPFTLDDVDAMHRMIRAVNELPLGEFG